MVDMVSPGVQIKEKDLLIRTLIIKEADVYNQGNHVNSYVGHESTDDEQYGQTNNNANK